MQHTQLVVFKYSPLTWAPTNAENVPLLTPCVAFYHDMSPQNSNCYKKAWVLPTNATLQAVRADAGRLWHTALRCSFWAGWAVFVACSQVWKQRWQMTSQDPAIRFPLVPPSPNFALLLCAYTTVPSFKQHKGTRMFGFTLIVVNSNWEVSQSSSRLLCGFYTWGGAEWWCHRRRCLAATAWTIYRTFKRFIDSRCSCHLTALAGFLFCSLTWRCSSTSLLHLTRTEASVC